MRSAPEMARLDRFPGDSAPAVRAWHLVASLPIARGSVEAAHLLKDERHELGRGRAPAWIVDTAQDGCRPLPQPPLNVFIRCFRHKTGHGMESGTVQEQSGVVQLVPTRDRVICLGGHRSRPPRTRGSGSRTSAVTGNTLAPPASAKRAGRRRLRMRVRSRRSWFRISS